MAIAVVSSTSAGSTTGNNVTTSAIDTTGATLIVVSLVDYTLAGSAGVLSDNQSNTWTGLTARTVVNSLRTKLYYVISPTTSASHTFTVTGTTDYPCICVLALSGTASSGTFDAESGTGSSSVASIQPGSITPAADNEILVTGVGLNASNTMSITTPFTISNQTDYVNGQHFGGGMAYDIQTTATARNPTWSWSTSTDATVAMAAFKAAAGGTTWGLLLGLYGNRLVVTQ